MTRLLKIILHVVSVAVLCIAVTACVPEPTKGVAYGSYYTGHRISTAGDELLEN